MNHRISLVVIQSATMLASTIDKCNREILKKIASIVMIIFSFSKQSYLLNIGMHNIKLWLYLPLNEFLLTITVLVYSLFQCLELANTHAKMDTLIA